MDNWNALCKPPSSSFHHPQIAAALSRWANNHSKLCTCCSDVRPDSQYGRPEIQTDRRCSWIWSRKAAVNQRQQQIILRRFVGCYTSMNPKRRAWCHPPYDKLRPGSRPPKQQLKIRNGSNQSPNTFRVVPWVLVLLKLNSTREFLARIAFGASNPKTEIRLRPWAVTLVQRADCLALTKLSANFDSLNLGQINPTRRQRLYPLTGLPRLFMCLRGGILTGEKWYQPHSQLRRANSYLSQEKRS